MKIGYEQIVENKQRPADTHLNGISLCLFQYWYKEDWFYVKQPGRSGTFIHNYPGITRFFREKHPNASWFSVKGMSKEL